MKEKISITDYANQITKALPKGILLNTNGDKFNSMVIGWGHLGTLWGQPTFVVYVRQSRYTKEQLDEALRQIEQMEDCKDILTTVAFNDVVYLYSVDIMSTRYAKALADGAEAGEADF